MAARDRRRVWVVAALVVALVAAGCTDGAGSNDPGSTTSNAPLVAPLVVEKEPLWSGRLPRGTYEIRGESLVGRNVGAEGEDGLSGWLVVMDVAPGPLLRWQVPDSGALPGGSQVRLDRNFLPRRSPPFIVVGGRAEWMAVVPYWTCPVESDDQGCVGYPAAQERYGVAGLSAADGSTLWKVPVVPQGAETEGLHHYVAAADENTVVSVVTTDFDFNLATARIVATDVAAKAVVWESSGMWPWFVVDDTVLGMRSASSPGPRDPQVPEDSVVVALDAGTGKEKWDLAGRYPASNVYLTLGDVVVVFVGGSSGYRAVVLDASTGEELVDLGEDVWECVDDGANLIACRTSRGGTPEIAIFDTESRKTSVNEMLDDFKLKGGWHGYFFLADRVVDREGNTVIDDLPGGAVEAMSDEYVVIENEATKEHTVHRVKKQ